MSANQDKILSKKRKQALLRWAFIGTAVGWFGLGLALTFHFSDVHPSTALLGFTGIWFWCAVDLLVLGKTVARLMALVSSRGPTERGRISREAIFWAFMKLGWLGSVLVLMGLIKNLPMAPVLLGFGSLIVIPIIGGWLSSRLTLPFDEEGEDGGGPEDTTSF